MTESTGWPSEPEVVWFLEREIEPLRHVVEFVIDGDPASKARARFSGRGSSVRTYTPEKTKRAEEECAALAMAAGAGPAVGDASFGLMAIFFTATWQRRDVDNMLKLVSDALTGLVWADDSQVTEMSGRVVRADQNPRTHVRVYQTRHQSPSTKPCPVCGKPVRSYRSVTYRTCSRACSLAVEKTVAWSCRTCGRQELRTPARARLVYCGTSCRAADSSPRVRQPKGLPSVRLPPRTHNANGYANGCRCQVCRSAWTVKTRELRAR